MTTAVLVLGAVSTVLLLVQVYLMREINRSRAEFLRQLKAASDERRQLIDRIMYMADKPWMLPEINEEPVPLPDPVIYPEQMVVEEEDEYAYRSFPGGRV